MRMDDLVPSSSASDAEPAISDAGAAQRSDGLRFTSNVVGSLFLLTDIICFIISAPITLAAYSLVRGSRFEPSVHITAFILMLGSFPADPFVATGLSAQPPRPERYQRYDVRRSHQQSHRIGPDLAGGPGRTLFSRDYLAVPALRCADAVSLTPDPKPVYHPSCRPRPDRAADRLLRCRPELGLANSSIIGIAEISAPSLRRHR